MALYRIDAGPSKILPILKRVYERALREEKDLTVSLDPEAVKALEDCKTIIECLAKVKCEHDGSGFLRLDLGDLADSLDHLSNHIRNGQ